MRILLDSNAYSQLMLGREQVSRIGACGRDRVDSAEGRAASDLADGVEQLPGHVALAISRPPPGSTWHATRKHSEGGH